MQRQEDGMTDARVHPNYVVIWYWLVGLAIVSVLLGSLPPPINIILLFMAATAKAVLVALYYMHLRFERLLISVLMLVPLVLFGILLLVLFPDITFHS
jgi:cytochrome c oxidase subunit 4